MKKKAIFFILTLFFTTKGFAQCAMCRAVLESEEGMHTAKGINDGIIYLMAIPYILVAGICIFIYVKFNKTKSTSE